MSGWGRHVMIPTSFEDVGDVTGTGPFALDDKCKGLLCGSAGTLNVTMRDGSTVDDLPFQAGPNLGDFAAIRQTASGAPSSIFQMIMEAKRV